MGGRGSSFNSSSQLVFKSCFSAFTLSWSPLMIASVIFRYSELVSMSDSYSLDAAVMSRDFSVSDPLFVRDDKDEELEEDAGRGDSSVTLSKDEEYLRLCIVRRDSPRFNAVFMLEVRFGLGIIDG